MRKKRTTLSLPPDLIDRAREAGLSNISEFCTRALEAYLDGLQDAELVSKKLLEEDQVPKNGEPTDEEILQIIKNHLNTHRDEILKHLAQHGSFGRKVVDQIRVSILLDTGVEVPPAQIRSALDELRDDAWKTGDLHLVHAQLQFDREFRLYGAKIYEYITKDEGRLAEAMHIKAEQDPGLTSLWASAITEHFAKHGITIHAPTVIRVLGMINR